MKTGHSVEFQNKAAQDAIIFLKPYFVTLKLTLDDVGAMCHRAEKGVLQPSFDNTGFYRDPENMIR